jgi:hypothetical protein
MRVRGFCHVCGSVKVVLASDSVRTIYFSAECLPVLFSGSMSFEAGLTQHVAANAEPSMPKTIELAAWAESERQSSSTVVLRAQIASPIPIMISEEAWKTKHEVDFLARLSLGARVSWEHKPRIGRSLCPHVRNPPI